MRQPFDDPLSAPREPASYPSAKTNVESSDREINFSGITFRSGSFGQSNLLPGFGISPVIVVPERISRRVMREGVLAVAERFYQQWLLPSYMSYALLAAYFGVSRPMVCYHIRPRYKVTPRLLGMA